MDVVLNEQGLNMSANSNIYILWSWIILVLVGEIKIKVKNLQIVGSYVAKKLRDVQQRAKDNKFLQVIACFV